MNWTTGKKMYGFLPNFCSYKKNVKTIKGKYIFLHSIRGSKITLHFNLLYISPERSPVVLRFFDVSICLSFCKWEKKPNALNLLPKSFNVLTILYINYIFKVILLSLFFFLVFLPLESSFWNILPGSPESSESQKVGPNFFFSKIFLLMRERERKEEGKEHSWDRETSIGCFPYVPWPEIEPTT